MAQDIYGPIEGRTVAIDKLAGTFRACIGCGNETATISTTPIGMHHGHLTCTKCGRLTAYLAREHLAAMLAAAGGRDAGKAVA
ncbi:MAG: hypothetical protein Unbinned338contig1000_21 [Prokaryotic dsDNA virus sp.]|nr:MAG: hypothetical protein Unbinned338contig1000_21 [Prokaryotic dsDNA virus sp.]|tara:strand:+ start:7512 stop:7760 length:249 start_codon:yes stop_codon:yes gene_type:complete